MIQFEAVLEQIVRMKSNKPQRSDSIQPWVLKELRDETAELLTMVYINSHLKLLWCFTIGGCQFYKSIFKSKGQNQIGKTVINVRQNLIN